MYIFFDDVPLERLARRCWACGRVPALGGHLRCVACRLAARRLARPLPWLITGLRPRERLRARHQYFVELRRIRRG